MGPKKKEREIDSSSTSLKPIVVTNGINGRSDPAQADHEMFLQAFESTLKDFAVKVFFTMIFEMSFQNLLRSTGIFAQGTTFQYV